MLDKLNKNKVFLILILLSAVVLRFYKLDSYPALNADEAAIGYNAYSLIKTGLDEHGNPWPIHFQSFDDYKPGLFFYMVMPFVKLLGLTVLAVRLPGALMGAAAVFGVYLLSKELFKKETLSLIAALFLAISPWHIHFSRGGWEVNVATAFIVFGFLLLLKAFKNPKYYIYSSILLVASLYTYHAARIIVPLLMLGFFVIYWRKVKNNLKPALLAAAVGALLMVPLLVDFTRPAISSRAAGVGLFADTGPLTRVNEQRGEHQDLASVKAKLFHNKPANYSLALLGNWAEHFWGEFLFLSGDDIERNKVPEMGQMYLVDAVFLIVGITMLIKMPSREGKFLAVWLLVAPIAAALTFQSPHALRSQSMVIPLVIISATGASYILEKVHKLKSSVRAVTIALTLLVLTWQFGNYLHQYWVHMAKQYTFSSQYGVEELMVYINKKYEDFDQIIITDRYDQPYILALFYGASANPENPVYFPGKFQSNHTLVPAGFGFSTVREYDKFLFESIKYDEMRPAHPNSLIIGTDEEIPDHANVVENIYGSNGKLYFQVVAN